MKKQKKSLYEYFEEDFEAAYSKLAHNVIVNGLIKGFILIILIIIAILFLNNVSNLSIISPNLFFLMTFCILIYILSTVAYYLFSKTRRTNTVIRIFQVYDMISFAGVLVSSLSFIVLFIFCPTIVEGGSMMNTFYDGDRILVWHMFYEPQKDDIVIINVTNNYIYNYTQTERFFIKRIVATSGDTIYYQDNSFYVNDNLIDSFISLSQFQKMTSHKNESIIDENNRVKDGYSIVLGDNRSNSIDSRIIGAINNSDIEGKVFFRFYSKNGSIGFPKKQNI